MSRKRKRRKSNFMAKDALKRVRRLERNVEVKSFDIAVTTIAAVSTVGDVRNIALIAQGDARVNRDGNAVSPFFLDMRFHWIGTSGDTIGVFRTIIFRDKRQVSNAVPLVLDVLTEAHPLSTFKYAFRKRFKIIYDETFNQSNDAAVKQQFLRVLRIKLSLKMAWSAAAAVNLVQNGLFMINISSLGANQPDFLFSSRVFFNDS